MLKSLLLLLLLLGVLLLLLLLLLLVLLLLLNPTTLVRSSRFGEAVSYACPAGQTSGSKALSPKVRAQ